MIPMKARYPRAAKRANHSAIGVLYIIAAQKPLCNQPRTMRFPLKGTIFDCRFSVKSKCRPFVGNAPRICLKRHPKIEMLCACALD